MSVVLYTVLIIWCSLISHRMNARYRDFSRANVPFASNSSETGWRRLAMRSLSFLCSSRNKRRSSSLSFRAGIGTPWNFLSPLLMMTFFCVCRFSIIRLTLAFGLLTQCVLRFWSSYMDQQIKLVRRSQDIWQISEKTLAIPKLGQLDGCLLSHQSFSKTNRETQKSGKFGRLIYL